jgi:hypothetical protein
MYAVSISFLTDPSSLLEGTIDGIVNGVGGIIKSAGAITGL